MATPALNSGGRALAEQTTQNLPYDPASRPTPAFPPERRPSWRVLAALVVFLHSLTDSAFLADPRHARPWADTLQPLLSAPASAGQRLPRKDFR